MRTGFSTPPVEPTHAAMEQAAEWYALLRSGEATADDTQRWRDWLAASPDHHGAWHYVETVSRHFAPLQDAPDPRLTTDNLLAANDRTRLRRRTIAGLAILAGSGPLTWMGWRHTALPGMLLAQMADYRTGTGEIREVTLNDGTQVWLNAATAFDQDYRSDLRRLRMLAGEVLIDTAADRARPFVVDTPQGRLHALGTRFTVRLDNDERSFLAVYQGAVEIRTATNQTIVVPAGRQVRFRTDALEAMADADTAREAWSRGVLVAQDITLAELVAELRRHRNGHLGLAPQVAGLRVFGSFPLRDTDETLAMLETMLPIRVRHTLPWWTSIDAADKT